MQFGDERLDLKGNRVAVARIVSRLTAAPLFNLYVALIIAAASPIGLGPSMTPVTVILVCIVLMVVLPIMPIVLQASRGVVDLDVSSREMRTRFFAFALVCYVVAYLVYWAGQCDVMRVLAAAYFFVTSGVTIATLKWKVSVHAAGVAGPSTAMMYMYGFLASPVVAVWLAVIWARTALKQHTLPQGVAGVLLGVLITATVYLVMYP